MALVTRGVMSGRKTLVPPHGAPPVATLVEARRRPSDAAGEAAEGEAMTEATQQAYALPADPTLDALYDEFVEAARVVHQAIQALEGISIRICDEANSERFSDQDREAIGSGIEAVYKELGLGRNQDEPKPGTDIAAPAPSPRILPRISFGKYAGRRFEDINSGYLNWVVHNISDEHVLATARYHLQRRTARGGPSRFA
jgi:hypothetical protein